MMLLLVNKIRRYNIFCFPIAVYLYATSVANVAYPILHVLFLYILLRPSKQCSVLCNDFLGQSI